MSESLEIVGVLGSLTPPGRLRRAIEQALVRAGARSEARTQLLDLAELRIAFADGRPPEELGDDTDATVARLASADAVMLATPVYRGSLTGALKNLLDQTPVQALRGKPVALVAMGATQHHFLGADRHLRDVLTFFGALVTPVSVYLTSADFADGEPNEAAGAELDELLDGLIGLTEMVRRAPGPLGPPPLIAKRR